MAATPTKRPASVTIAFVILLVYSILAVLGYGLVLIFIISGTIAVSASSVVGVPLVIVSAIPFVLALVQLAVAFGVKNGSNGARIIVIVLSLLSAAAQVWAFVNNPDQPSGGWVGFALNLVVIIALLTRSANSYFGKR